MKKKADNRDMLTSLAISLGAFFILTEGNKWSETLIYTLAITITLYSYLIASAAVLSFMVYSIWAVVQNLRKAAKLKIENMEMIKSITKRMNEIYEQQVEQHA